jgi:hypothetical protein
MQILRPIKYQRRMLGSYSKWKGCLNMSICLLYGLNIRPASQVSKQKAGTNVPIQCKLCPAIHWKYNMRRHLQDRHPSWEANSTTEASELNKFRTEIAVTNKEETRLGIPGNKKGWLAATYADVYDMRRLNYPPSVHDNRGDSPRRQRQMYAPFPSLNFSSMPARHLDMHQVPIYNTTDVFS